MVMLYTSEEIKSFRRCNNNREMVAQLVLVPSLIAGSLHCPFLLHRSQSRCVPVAKHVLQVLVSWCTHLSSGATVPSAEGF